jgi:DNA helicase HerA-like ATPase
LVREDGAYVRYLEVGAVNPLALDEQELDRVSRAFAGLAARLPDRQSLQLYVQARDLALEELLADEAYRCEQAAGAAEDECQGELAELIRQFGEAQEQSLRLGAQAVHALSLRYLVVCPWTPQRTVPALRRRRVSSDVHARAVRDSLRHCEGVRADLEGLGLPARMLEGSEVLDLLHERFDPSAAERGELPASFMHPNALQTPSAGEQPRVADARAGRVAQAICTAGVDLSDPTRVVVGGVLEEVMYVSLAPEQTWVGWLLHLMQAPRPFTLAVHVQATERYRERMAQKRRYRRIYGVNRGVEQRGRPLDPDARMQEHEAAELTDELAASAGGIYRVSIYTAISEPNADGEALRDTVASAGREVTMACDARVQNGRFAQARLWRSTLPLGQDAARRRRRYVSRNVGDSIPLVGASCSSPTGIPVGYALPGRTLQRLDPFDPRHPNHLLLVNGMSGAGKTMATILLLIRALAHGASGFIIDRAGHFAFLASLIPGAVSASIGGDAHAINCWDVEDPAEIPAEKVDYLLALHALLLGEHHAAQDSYGLSDLESNLLGLAIGEVYERCALTGEEPRELLLQEELERRYHDERQEGSVGIAEALRNLSMRLNNYIAGGPYAYLTDRATTVPPDAPLVVFDTRAIPDAKAPAALFVICELVKSRISQTRRRHLEGQSARHGWAGRSFLVIDEAWHLIQRPATGRWFNEFCRRSRHYALWLIAISQQLSDFDNEYGRALLANASMLLMLRQESRELAYAKDTLRLTSEAIDAISNLQTYRGLFSTAYLMNGVYGEASVQLWVSARDYWIATSDPARDERIRSHALQQTGDVSLAALALLEDHEWQKAAATELGLAA